MPARALTTTGVVLAALAGLTVPAPAQTAATAHERMVVVIVADDDTELSDDLTEVAIATIADRRDRDVIGIPELRPRLRELAATDDVAGCIADGACLAKLGGAAGAGRAVAGTVRVTDSEFLLKVALIDLRSARQDADVSVTLPRDRRQLVVGLQRAVDELLRSPSPLSKRVAVTTVPPPAEIPAPTLSASPDALAGEPQRTRGRLLSTVGYAAGALAIVSIVAAIVTGSIASGKPVGDDRRAAQADLERREDYATAATTLGIGAGVFSAVALGAFTWTWRAP
jgi:hypothetical protein